ncbi:MAG: hypothetical protein AAGK71_03840 [Pseudomonadota bacterium]
MGRVVWIAGACLVAILAAGMAVELAPDPVVKPVVATNEVELSEPLEREPISLGSTGSALATAAFGLSALQPETFNSQIVRDIIEASPLAYGEKDRLTAKLLAAEAGQGELPRVLADIRVSLAVE